MPDYSALTRGFQEGSDWAQRYRANKQMETARDQTLERGEYDLQSARDYRRAQNPDAAAVLGPEYAAGNMDWGGQLQDPFAYKLLDWFKSRMHKRKAQAITPTDATISQPSGVQTFPLDEEPLPEGESFADGGSVSEDEKVKRAAERYRQGTKGEVSSSTETVRGADRTTAPSRGASADEATGKLMSRARQGEGFFRRAGKAIGRVGAAGALAGTAVDTASTDTEDYRKRFGLETNDPSLLGDIGVRALGAASDLGNLLTFGAAGKLYRDKQQAIPAEQAAAPVSDSAVAPAQAAPAAGTSMTSATSSRQAVPTSAGPKPQMVNFGDIDIEPKDVPNMQMDDWKKYRAQMIAAAQKSGRPEAVGQVNDMVTHMQQQGFLNYGQQGLALQQAGNVRGAMAAYRAAFQYFPNGNDVEFGTHIDRKTGRKQIVGFGLDEKTGKVVPGTELVMDPERVATLIENFKNPQAFRMWTKDWRDFQQNQREYEEVKKPLAQAQADALATNSDANVLRAENAALRAGGSSSAGAANMRNAERVFRERLQMMGLQDEGQADYLASVMSQVKAANPQVPDNAIVQVIMQASKDGTLKQRLQRMGIQ